MKKPIPFKAVYGIAYKFDNRLTGEIFAAFNNLSDGQDFQTILNDREIAKANEDGGIRFGLYNLSTGKEIK